jgi:excinuclease UvrABC nuclease subunit
MKLKRRQSLDKVCFEEQPFHLFVLDQVRRQTKNHPGIYGVFDFDEQCLYIAHADNVREKLSAVYKENYNKWFAKHGRLFFRWEPIVSIEDMNQRLKELTKKLKPIYTE